MNKKTPILSILILSAFAVFPCFPSSSPERESAEPQVPQMPQQPQLPERQQPSGSLVEEIRNLTETGILSSMLQALELIRSRDISSSDFGRMMIGINVSLIRFVYSDNPARLPAVDLPQTFNYTRIIREAERGNYIRPPPDSDDFFEHILPILSINFQTRAEIFPEILRDLEKAGELRPNSVLPPYFQGVVYERSGRFSLAQAAYKKAFEISDECYPALTGVARMMRHTGSTAEALEIFSDLMLRYPDSIDIKRQLAITCYEHREWQKALTVVDEILFSDPRNGEFLLMKAHIHIEQGQYSQANASLDTYASINSNNRFYLFYRARVQAEGNRNRDSALNYLRSILRTNANDTEVLVYAVTLLMESARPADITEGRELLERLRQISGSSVEVLSLNLNDAVRRENWQEAQGYLNQILSVRRTESDLVNAFYVERGLGNNANALAYASELYNQAPSNNNYTVNYISSLIDNGRRDQASRLLESRLNTASNGTKSQLYYLRSRIQSNEEAVLNDLRSSIFENPRNLDALIAMFEIYHRNREERRAVYYLRQALAIAPDNPRLKRYETEYAHLLDR